MTPTTNKLVRLDDVMKVMNSRLNIPSSIFDEMQSLPTYQEPIKGSNLNLMNNKEILQKYIDKYPCVENEKTSDFKYCANDINEILCDILSHLIEPNV